MHNHAACPFVWKNKEKRHEFNGFSLQVTFLSLTLLAPSSVFVPHTVQHTPGCFQGKHL